jgi:hypothetical protein
MGFVIEKVGSRKSYPPEGHYVLIEGIEYQIYELTISASGKVCMKIWDPTRKEHQVKTLCSVEELINATIPGGIYKEY